MRCREVGEPLTSCQIAEVQTSRLLSAEDFPTALSMSQTHLQALASHGEICQYNLARAYWGMGDQHGDEAWARNRQETLTVEVTNAQNETSQSHAVVVGRQPEEVNAERLYYQLRSGRIDRDDLNRYLDASILLDDGAQARARILTAWLRLREGDFTRASDATAAYDQLRSKDYKLMGTCIPLEWQRRMATADMVSLALTGKEWDAANVAHAQQAHPVASSRQIAKAINRTWQLGNGSPGLVAWKKQRTQKLATKLLGKVLPPNQFDAIVRRSYLDR